MIFLGLSVLLFVFGILALVFGKTVTKEGKYTGRTYDEWGDLKTLGGIATTFAVLFLLFGSLLPTGIAYVRQVEDIENVKRLTNLEGVYASQAEDITGKIKEYLAEQYPQHERAIFEGLSPDALLIYLARYPELKASATLVNLAENVKQLREKIYAQQVAKEGVLKDVRVRERNPWYLTFVLPKN